MVNNNKNFIEAIKQMIQDGCLSQGDAEKYFPELKEESEGERVRKELIEFVKSRGGFKQEYIAWLEKQGEHANFRNKIQIGDKVTRNEDGVLVNLSQLNRVAKVDEKQNEQKLADKIQPKFKIGDIIRFKGNETLKGEEETHKIVNYDNELYVFADGTTDLFCEQDLYELVEQKPADKVEPKFKVGDFIVNDYCMGRIVEITNDAYLLDTEQGIPFSCEHNAHLWTIQDAKDGDVLSFNDGHGNDCIELIKSITGNKIEFWFCLTNGNRYEVFDGITPYTNLASREDAAPATKEQRYTLEKAMTNAGYVWDAEKKELKKIEQKPTEDANLPEFESYICLMLQKFRTKGMCTNGEIIDYVKEHAQKLRDILVKSAWSEEDEKGWTNTMIMIKEVASNHYTKDSIDLVVNWLNSLKDRVQPQPKQEWKQENTGDLTDFENAMMHIGNSFFGDNAGLNPNDTNAIKEQANLLLELVPVKEWSEEDEMIYQHCKTILHDYGYDNWLKSLRPQPKNEWDKNDELNRQDTIRLLTDAKEGYLQTDASIPKCIKWLENLSPQSHWKPSDEQMKALKEACNKHWKPDGLDPLYTLWEQLKALV